MRFRSLVLAIGAAAAALARPAVGMQCAPPSAAAARSQKAPEAPTRPIEIWQVDLVPTGTGFAVTEPRLEGDTYVFKAWPDQSPVRVSRSKIKKITPRTKQLASETAYRLDLAPTGEIFARDNPTLKGTTYTFHRWRDGNLMSLKQSDVKKVTKLTPAEIFEAHLKYFGPKPIGNLAMEGGTVIAPAQPSASTNAYAGDQTPVNWIYEGTPGIDDAWAPPSATVAYPGDVPKAAEPH